MKFERDQVVIENGLSQLWTDGSCSRLLGNESRRPPPKSKKSKPRKRRQPGY